MIKIGQDYSFTVINYICISAACYILKNYLDLFWDLPRLYTETVNCTMNCMNEC